MPATVVSLHTAAALGPAALFGVQELRTALERRGYRLSGPQPTLTIQVELAAAGTPTPDAPAESYAISRPQPDRLHVAGSDDNGVLYGCLDLAEQLEMGSDLSGIPEHRAAPDLQVRGLYTFLHNPDSERDWLYDPAYWQAYAGQLARDRYNRFNLIYGHQSPHLIPIYAFMLDDLAQEFPQIQVAGITAQERARNLQALQDASSAMHSRGLAFFLGIWNSRPWKTENGLWETQPTRVTGTDDLGLLTTYTQRGFTRLMELCPHISGIQFRLNIESGIADQRFFVQAFVPALKDLAARGRRLTIELRSWGLLPDTTEAFRSTGMDIVVSCKYFAEHQGLPYQPPAMRGSYSYDSFLRKDKPFPFQWQLWNLGSHRLFAWGDPDYARRFAESCHLANGVGFEVTPPGSQKGFSEWGYVLPGDWQARRDLPQQWDFQRYWFFHSAFGRLAYDAKTDDAIFVHQLAKRTTPQAAPALLAAYKQASKVVSYLISMRMDDLNMYVWPELDCGGPIDHNTLAPSGEVTLFATAREYAQALAAGKPDARLSPFDQARDLDAMAASIEESLRQLAAMPGLAGKDEYRFVSVDFHALANLARYHAAKQRAGGNLALFYIASDVYYLDLAEAEATRGVQLWQELCACTQVYHHKLHLGPSGGHWDDNLPRVQRDVQRIQRVRELFDSFGLFVRGFDLGPGLPRATSERWQSGLEPEPRFSGVSENDGYTAERGFGWLRTAGIRSLGPGRFDQQVLWGMHIVRPGVDYDPAQAEVMPLDGLTQRYLSCDTPRTLRVDVPDGEYQMTLLAPAVAGAPAPVRTGNLRTTVGRKAPVLAQTFATVQGGKLDITIGRQSPWALAGLILRPRAPLIAHLPPMAVEFGKDLLLTATATAPDKIASLRLRYKATGGKEDVLLQGEGGRLRAVLPANATADGTLEYVLVAQDEAGHVTEAGPFRVAVVKGYKAPHIIAASGPAVWSRTAALSFSLTMENAAWAREVTVHYREADQNRLFRTAPMKRVSSGQYAVQVDPLPLDDSYELIYYFSVVDVLGHGSFYPDPFHDARYRICKPR